MNGPSTNGPPFLQLKHTLAEGYVWQCPDCSGIFFFVHLKEDIAHQEITPGYCPDCGYDPEEDRT